MGLFSDQESIAVCAYCTGAVYRNAGPRCDSCEVFHHVDCWEEFSGCTTYGCVRSPDMIRYQGVI
jgi:hypothetical protein